MTEANTRDEVARRIVIANLRSARAEAQEPKLNAELLLAILYLEGKWPTPETQAINENK